jgi:hypothetical protein
MRGLLSGPGDERSGRGPRGIEDRYRSLFRTAGEVYTLAIEHGFISRLGHAAPLGQDLANAELAPATGHRFVQDAVPED